MANVDNLPAVATWALVIIALAGVVMAAAFLRLTRALIANTESIRRLTQNLDLRLSETMDQAAKSIADVNAITERVNGQMDRIERIVGNVEHVSRDARSSMHMVNATVSPTLANLHALIGGLRKGVDTWKEQDAEDDSGV